MMYLKYNIREKGLLGRTCKSLNSAVLLFIRKGMKHETKLSPVIKIHHILLLNLQIRTDEISTVCVQYFSCCHSVKGFIKYNYGICK